MQNNDKEFPPIEFDGDFSGYNFFDPRSFWEKVAEKDCQSGPPTANRDLDETEKK